MAGRRGSTAHRTAVREIKAGLRSLMRGLRRLAKEAQKEAPRRPGSRRKVSPGRRIHGRYIGLIRNLPVRAKAKVRAVRARKGVEAAIKMAQELRRSR